MVAGPALDQPLRISGGVFNDIDEQAAQYGGYEQQYQQLSRGPFEGRVHSFNFDTDLAIHFEMANRELAQSASTPAEHYGACILADSSPPCALNGSIVAQNHVVVCPQYKSLEGKTFEGTSIYCMDISCDLLPDNGCDMETVGAVSDAARVRQLRELVQSGLAAFVAQESLGRSPTAVREFKSSLVDLVWQISVQAGDRNSTGVRHSARANTVRVFRRAREYIERHLSDGVSIVALCSNTGVSRRTLECVFRSVVGMGPGNYIRVLRLNLARRDLITDASDVPIGVIAARHGLWHWSRFSHYYRQVFGELPSQTRVRYGGSLRYAG